MIGENRMREILAEALGGTGDFAEIFFEDSIENNLYQRNGTLDKAEAVRICGAGIYVLRGTNSAYVYTNDMSFEGLAEAARQASGLLACAGGLPQPWSKGGADTVAVSGKRYFPNPNPCRVRPSQVEGSKRTALVEEAARIARQCSPDLIQLEVAQFAREQHVTVVNTEGLYTEDDRVTDRLRFRYVLSRGGEQKSGWGDYTRPQGWEAYDCMEPVRQTVRELFTGASASFFGKRVKACRVPVIMEAGVCGTLWHEACGHPLEASSISSHSSEYEGLLGQKIATDKVTLIDDGTIPGLYGSRAIDDEGHPTQKNVLIEKGVLKGYLCDRLGGRRLGTASTGSGRRQGYMYAPMARMSNTYLEVGEDSEEDLLSSVDEGLYVKSFGGGSGGREFSLEVSEGYWIHNGQITYPVKGLMLTGRGLDLLKKIDGVGRIQGYDGGGFCGADSGLCPVTSYQPRIRVSEMSIGGEEA
ncbi:MAG: TldD/PmbA family protein [Lachnospiraceae bacterium]|jgi:TldD protein|nr:TldD/PmbA family protein [Lachnospiraceae bacterium]